MNKLSRVAVPLGFKHTLYKIALLVAHEMLHMFAQTFTEVRILTDQNLQQQIQVVSLIWTAITWVIIGKDDLIIWGEQTVGNMREVICSELCVR